MFDAIQWNIQGFKAKYEEFMEVKESKPAMMCIQESMLGNNVPTARGYSVRAFSPTDRPVAGAGLLTFIRNDIPFQEIPLITQIQANAFRVKLRKEITVCNIYITQNFQLTVANITSLFNQLPPPFLVVGDFNSRHPLWGDNTTNDRGRVMINFIERYRACFLNNGQPTHFHTQTGTFSAVDLSISSPELVAHHIWTVAESSRGSDHFPITISESVEGPPPASPRYIIARADWPRFTALTHMEMDAAGDDIDELVDIFNDKVHSAAVQSISQTAGQVHGRPVPWWNAECKLVNIERKRALRRYQRTRLLVDKIAYSRARAKARLVKRRAKRSSWQQYVTTINSKTSATKVWKRINKTQGKYSTNPAPTIQSGGNVIIDQQAVSNLMAEHFYNVSSNNRYDPQFLPIKEREESNQLNFTTNEEKEYNIEISANEVQTALSQCRNTSPGPDKIHYEMLRHLSDSACDFLLRLYNKIWFERAFPVQWGRAFILPFVKKDKPPTQAESYRPIALTSCVCKLLERVVNNRLQYVLEKNNLISDVQLGFRKMRGTEDAHVQLQTAILNAFAVRQQLVAVFFLPKEGIRYDMEAWYITSGVPVRLTWQNGPLYR